MHYKRVLTYGGPGPVGKIGKHATLEDRFINSVKMFGPIMVAELGACHVWTGCVHPSGYGVIRSGHKLIYVHRLAYAMAYGPPPVGWVVAQVCENRLCVRPDHLVARKRGGPR